ncbi:VCBS domain-containing protein, partial [Polynucleobacter sp. AP-Titi-500A-B4]|uniref:VCBS domain-containing protein n=1 Tax=Polynucleobacter sp. AP-Titi-500A-B4 TaxID=2576923 RepID=UPI001BFEA44D
DTVDGTGGVITWDYKVADSKVEYLAIDETKEETFTITLDDGNGGTVDRTITITITGTNDKPEITTGDTEGEYREQSGYSSDLDAYGNPLYIDSKGDPIGLPTELAHGALTFTDVDLTDTHEVKVLGNPDNPDAPVAQTIEFSSTSYTETLLEEQLVKFYAGMHEMLDGALTVSVDTDSTDSGEGKLAWSFSGDDQMFDGLGVGETLTVTYDVQVVDDSSGESNTKTITITIVGSNDAPTFKVTEGDVSSGAFSEQEDYTDGTYTGSGEVPLQPESNDSATGTLSFVDLDITDNHIVTHSDPTLELITGSGDESDGSTEDDSVEQGDDDVTKTSGFIANHVHLLEISGNGEYVDVLKDASVAQLTAIQQVITSGKFTIENLDKFDGYWHIANTGVHDDSTGVGIGKIDWKFDVLDANLDFLSEGQKLELIYQVKVEDPSGATGTQDVKITITGSNDLPVITAGDAQPVFEQEGYTAGKDESDNSNVDPSDAISGTLSFTDVDLSDVHTVTVLGNDTAEHAAQSIVWNPNDLDAQQLSEQQVTDLHTTLDGALTVTLAEGDDSTGSGNGLVSWSFSADDEAFDFLGQDETLTVTYDVKVADAFGESNTRSIIITVTGSNDKPVFAAEEADGSYQEGFSSQAEATGVIDFTDVDLTDMHTVSVLESPSLSFTVDTTGSHGESEDDSDSSCPSEGDDQEESSKESSESNSDDTSENSSTTTIVINESNHIRFLDIHGNNVLGSASEAQLLGIQKVIAESMFTLEGYEASEPSIFVQGDTPNSSAGKFNWAFTIDDAKLDFLNVGQTLELVYQVQVVDEFGGTDSKDITVSIVGSNDAAVITGESTGMVIKPGVVLSDDKDDHGYRNFKDVDGKTSVDGHLTATDVDSSANFNQVNHGKAEHGSYSINANGDWSYDLNTNDAAIKKLNDGGTLEDKFTVSTVDGTKQEIIITIKGTNTAAVITGSTVGSVTEAGVSNGQGTPNATGTLTYTDADNTDNVFNAVSTATLSESGYGKFTVTTDGQWNYVLDNNNSKVQKLNDGQKLYDSFTVTTPDGSKQQINITINGKNDAAVISEDRGNSHDVTQYNKASYLTAGGKLFSEDADGDSSFRAGNYSGSRATGGKNFGTLTVKEDGSYELKVLNSQLVKLGASDTLVESFTVKSSDGTEKVLTFNYHGINDAPTTSNPVNTDTFSAAGPGKTIDLISKVSDLDGNSGLSISNLKIDGSDYTTAKGSALGLLLTGNLLKIDPTAAHVTSGSKTIVLGYDVKDPSGNTVHMTENVVINAGYTGSVTQGIYSSGNTMKFKGAVEISDNFEYSKTSSTSDNTIGKLTFSDEGNFTYSVTKSALTSALNSHSGWFTDGHKVETFTVQFKGEHDVSYSQTLSFVINTSSSSEYSAAINSAKSISIHGKSIDGYISGATVFADANSNMTLDSGESSTITDATGGFTLTGGTGNLVMVGGTDVTTGLKSQVVLTALAGSTVITPITTLIEKMVDNGNLSVTDASTKLAAQFGLSSVLDLSIYDPVAAALAGDVDAEKVFAAGVEILNTIAQATAFVSAAANVSSTKAGDAIFDALANKMATSLSADVISSASDLTAAVKSSLLALNVSTTKVNSYANAIDSLSALIVDSNSTIETIVANPNLTMMEALNQVIQVGSAAQGSLTTQISQAVSLSISSGADLATYLPNATSVDLAIANASYNAPSYFDAVTGDNYLNNAEFNSANGLTVSGVAPVNSFITLNIGGLTNIPVMADATGQWTYTLSKVDVSTLGAGTQQVTATATVLDANNLVVSTTDLGTQIFTVDLTAPTIGIAGFTIDSGSSASDRITNDNTPTLTGTAEAGSLVTL